MRAAFAGVSTVFLLVPNVPDGLTQALQAIPSALQTAGNSLAIGLRDAASGEPGAGVRFAGRPGRGEGGAKASRRPFREDRPIDRGWLDKLTMTAIFYPGVSEDEPAGSSRDAGPPKYRGDKTPAIRHPSLNLIGPCPEKVAWPAWEG